MAGRSTSKSRRGSAGSDVPRNVKTRSVWSPGAAGGSNRPRGWYLETDTPLPKEKDTDTIRSTLIVRPSVRERKFFKGSRYTREVRQAKALLEEIEKQGDLLTPLIDSVLARFK